MTNKITKIKKVFKNKKSYYLNKNNKNINEENIETPNDDNYFLLEIFIIFI